MVSATNSIGTGPSAAATNLYGIGVSINGSGSGAVNSSPGGISCTEGTCVNDFSPVLPVNQVTLTPSASNGSQFTEWNGACSGAGVCNVGLNQLYQTVSASFSVLPNVQIFGSTKRYGLLQSTYNDAAGSSVIQAKSMTFVENLALGSPKEVEIKGGFDANFSVQTGRTILQGILTIRQGCLRADHLAID